MYIGCKSNIDQSRADVLSDSTVQIVLIVHFCFQQLLRNECIHQVQWAYLTSQLVDVVGISELPLAFTACLNMLCSQSRMHVSLSDHEPLVVKTAAPPKG